MSEDIKVMQYGDIGTKLEVIVTDRTTKAVVDISSATVKKIIIQKPDGSILEKDATLTTPPGTNGKMYYATASGDIDQSGDWHYQGYVEMPGGKWNTGPWIDFKVEPNIKPS